jgi:tRNA-specific 2-thiouridylase
VKFSWLSWQDGCNEHVKLGPLLAIARRLGAERIATGHYARVRAEGAEGVVLERAADLDRDQSYFLFAAPRDALRALELPLGELTKPAVRAHAARLGLRNAAKPDSTDLCFVEGADYAAWVEAHGGAAVARPGAIETVDGATVGTHGGVHRYTVGQRRGVGAVDGRPRYVLRIVSERNAVVVGTDAEARVARVTLREPRWLAAPPPERVTVKVRYRHGGTPARLVCDDAAATLVLDEPQRGVAPGQAAVCYDGTRVVGGGWIA